MVACSCRHDTEVIPPGGPVVLVVIDTLRADHLGFHGYPRPTSPNLDRLAERGIVYERTYSHYSFTWPTVSNLFTGVAYSRLVAARRFLPPNPDMSAGGLTGENVTLAERLADAGIVSHAVSANPYLNSHLGFAQGFVRFHDIYSWNPNFWKSAIHKYTADELNAEASSSLRELCAQGHPWFLYLHYFDPHMPYRPAAADLQLFSDPAYDRTGRVVDGYLLDPKGNYLSYRTPELESWLAPADLARLVALYDGEIRRADRAVGALVEELSRLCADDKVTLIVTADHGEAFQERGFWGHGFLSRTEEEHVPLLVVPPRRAGVSPRRVDSPVTTADIFFSLLRHFGLPQPPGEAGTGWAYDLLRAEAKRPTVYTEGGNGARILRSRRLAYYLYEGLSARNLPLPVRDGEYLFDLQHDPREQENLFEREPTVAATLRQRLLLDAGLADMSGWPAPPAEDPLAEGGEEVRRRLRALGYL